ncbi:hypothetical protein TrRE_jg430, partial [Triparma retinervis]
GAAGGGEKRGGKGGKAFSEFVNDVKEEENVDSLSAVTKLFHTVEHIFHSRKDFENTLGRHLDEIDFDWPRRILERAKEMGSAREEDLRVKMSAILTMATGGLGKREEEGEEEYGGEYDDDEEVGGVGDGGNRDRNISMMSMFTDGGDEGSYGSSETDSRASLDDESAVSILVRRRRKLGSKSMKENKKKAKKRMVREERLRIMASHWYVDAVVAAKDGSRGKEIEWPVIALLNAVRVLVVNGFGLDKRMLGDLMERILKPADHKLVAVINMLRRLRGHVGMGSREYLDWLKERNIQPPAVIIREFKKGSSGRGGRRRGARGRARSGSKAGAELGKELGWMGGRGALGSVG